jgi:hypothetical protein
LLVLLRLRNGVGPLFTLGEGILVAKVLTRRDDRIAGRRSHVSRFYLDRAVEDDVSSVCDEVDRDVIEAKAASSASSAWGEAGVVETTPMAWASPVVLLSFAAVEVAMPWPA